MGERHNGEPAQGDPSIGEPPGIVGWVEFQGTEAIVFLEWPVPTHDLVHGLSKAERDVLTLALAGLSSDLIAARRRRSRRTVENQLASLFAKLGVRCRLQLFARFAASGAGGDA